MLHVIFLVLKFVEDCIEWLETMHVVGRKWAYFSTLIEIHPVSVTCSLFDSFLFFYNIVRFAKNVRLTILFSKFKFDKFLLTVVRTLTFRFPFKTFFISQRI